MGRLTGRRFHNPQEVLSHRCWRRIYCEFMLIYNWLIYTAPFTDIRYLNLWILDLQTTRPFLLVTEKRVCRYLNLWIPDLLTTRPFLLVTEMRVSLSLEALQALRVPFQNLKSWRRRATYEFSFPIGVFKESGISVPKYSNPSCQLTLHYMVAGCQTPTCGCHMLAWVLS
jgi:hypothetical protein